MPATLLSRAPIQRMADIADRLRSGRRFTARDIAKRFEMDPKTIRRDLDFMRDRLGWDFTYDSRRNSYFLNKAPKPIL